MSSRSRCFGGPRLEERHVHDKGLLVGIVWSRFDQWDPRRRTTSPSPRENLVAMGIVGYADRLSVQPGETIQFMVSSQLPRYQAEIVRLIHGDPNPRGPGMKEEVIEAPVNREYAGRH